MLQVLYHAPGFDRLAHFLEQEILKAKRDDDRQAVDYLKLTWFFSEIDDLDPPGQSGKVLVRDIEIVDLDPYFEVGIFLDKLQVVRIDP